MIRRIAVAIKREEIVVILRVGFGFFKFFKKQDN